VCPDQFLRQIDHRGHVAEVNLLPLGVSRRGPQSGGSARTLCLERGQALKDAEIEDFIEGFKQRAWRGMRVNGERVPVWSSRNGWSGM